MNVLTIIQARTGSTRLPRKVLRDLAGKTVLEHVVDRASRASLVDEAMVATTTEEDDNALAEWCTKRGIRVFRGSSDDVLDRYYQAARALQPKHVVRITSDCPAIDPAVIDAVVALHLDKRPDYTANTLGAETYPDGQDIEIFTFETLEKAWQEAKLRSEREHVTPYIRNHPEIFSLENLAYERNLAHMRWTLDTEQDALFLEQIFAALYPKDPFFKMEDVLHFLEEHPELESINGHIERNLGLKKSLQEDSISMDQPITDAIAKEQNG